LEDILHWHFFEQGYYEGVVDVEEIVFLDE
jgi:hypothetical protein